jgi:hypothetical protein
MIKDPKSYVGTWQRSNDELYFFLVEYKGPEGIGIEGHRFLNIWVDPRSLESNMLVSYWDRFEEYPWPEPKIYRKAIKNIFKNEAS